MKKKTLLFVTYGGGHVLMVIPVIKFLERWSSSVNIRVVGLTTASKALEASGIAHVGMRQFATNEQIAIGKSIVGGVHNEGSGVSLEESVAYAGAGLADLMEMEGVERARQLYESFGRRVFSALPTFKRILEAEGPDAVVTTNCPVGEEAARFAARDVGIPHLAMEDLFCLQNALSLLNRTGVWCDSDLGALQTLGLRKERLAVVDGPLVEIPAEYIGYRDVRCGIVYDHYATVVTVLCNRSAENLLARGVRRPRISVCGNPSFDRLNAFTEAGHRDMRSGARKALLRHVGGATGARLIGFLDRLTGTGGEWRFRELLRAIASTIEAEFEVVVRLHPSDDDKRHREIAEEAGVAVHFSCDTAFERYLLSIDVLVSGGSTAVIEAAVLGTPVILFDPPGLSVLALQYRDLGLGIEVTDSHELPEALGAVVNDVRQSDAAAEAAKDLGIGDGSSAARVGREILGLAGLA